MNRFVKKLSFIFVFLLLFSFLQTTVFANNEFIKNENKNILLTKNTTENIIFIGDSRTCGTYLSLGGKTSDNLAGNKISYYINDTFYSVYFYAKVGSGFSHWFDGNTFFIKESHQELIDQLEFLNDSGRPTKCFIWLGVNDYGAYSVGKYVNAIEKLSITYPNIEFCYYSTTSINPTLYTRNNAIADIEKFNENIRVSLEELNLENVSFLDIANSKTTIENQTSTINGFIENSTKYTSDGLHYVKPLYIAIFENMLALSSDIFETPQYFDNSLSYINMNKF